MDAKTLCGPKGKQDNFMIQTFLKPSAEVTLDHGLREGKAGIGEILIHCCLVLLIFLKAKFGHREIRHVGLYGCLS